MKIGVFSDSHYCSAERLGANRRCSLSLDKTKQALEDFKKQGVDVCVCLGDVIDHYHEGKSSKELLGEVSQAVKNSGLPFLYAPGNHDYCCMSPEDIAGILGVSVPPYSAEICGCRFIVLDGNFDSNMVRFGSVPFDWKDSNLPKDQLDYLQKALEDSRLPCIVMVHEPLDPFTDEAHCINNAADARKIISESGKVALVIQGHYHCGADHIVDGIRYFTSDAMCNGEENHYTVIEV
ncbi:MAG: metallophosphoesterase [Clostridia bacterium]|nr:metallophosphoesterase [Clostridia bacterium]